MRAADELERLPHIGPGRATRLRRALGADLVAMLDAAPERVLGTLHGVTPEEAQQAAERWRALRLTDCRRASAPTRRA